MNAFRFLPIIVLLTLSMGAQAQKDSIKIETTKKVFVTRDTFRVGSSPDKIEKTYIIKTDSSNGVIEKNVQVFINGTEPKIVMGQPLENLITSDTMIFKKSRGGTDKTDTIKVGKTTIITRTETGKGNEEKKVEVTIDGNDLGNIIEKQIVLSLHQQNLSLSLMEFLYRTFLLKKKQNHFKRNVFGLLFLLCKVISIL